MCKLIKEANNFTVQMLNSKYKGYYLGLIWDIISPYFRFGAYYLAITFGLRSGRDINGVSYLAWLMIGLIPWLFISETLVAGAKAFVSNDNFIRTSTINLKIYPISSILQTLYTNMIVFVISSILVISMGVKVNLHWLNIIYYYIMMSLYMYSLSTIFSIITVWIKDFGKLLQSITVMLFWATPILYTIGNVTSSSPIFVKLTLFNPFFYFIDGIRQSILFEGNFWDTFLFIDAYIIIITCINLVIGRYLFKRHKSIIKDII